MSSIWRPAAFVLALLTPVFWAGRPQAADLPSHTYNVWLAQLIRQGEAPGLWIEPVILNTLYERLMDLLLGWLSYAAAESIAFAFCVLVLGGGAALWVRAAAGRAVWGLAPLLLAAAHGFVTQAGFANFMLSVGFAAAAGAGLLAGGRWIWPAAPAALLAFIANPMGAAMMAGLSLYLWAARRLEPRRQAWLFAAALLALAGAGAWIRLALPSGGVFHPLAFLGAATLLPYRLAYLAPAVLLIVFVAWMALEAIRSSGARQVLTSPPAQALALAAAACLILPGSIRFPGHAADFAFVSLRLSLAVFLAAAAWLGGWRLPRIAPAGASAVALLYFGLLLADHLAFRRLDGAVRAAAADLPPRARAALPHAAAGYLLDPLAHALDRACTGRCYSYFNYEPASRHFRVRASADNPIAVADRRSVVDFEVREFEVRPPLLPLYVLEFRDGRFQARPAAAGERLKRAPIPLP